MQILVLFIFSFSFFIKTLVIFSCIVTHTSLTRHLEHLGLLFEKEPGPNNLCFANENAELRNEFKRVFTPQDLHYYILANPAGQLPEDTDEFWKGVEKGKRLSLTS